MATSSEFFITKLKEHVQSAFDEVREALDVREKLLMRQIDVIASQSHSNASLIEEIKFLPCDEIDLLSCIRSFGKFNVDNLNLTNDLYTNEDYICPSVDHETMYKCLDGNDEVDGDSNDNREEIVVNFSNNKTLIRENVGNLNESIINITLKEVKNLIEKNQLYIPTNQTKDVEPTAVTRSSTKGYHQQQKQQQQQQISQSSQTETEIRNFKCKKPNITINNCNGTINLKNISTLTINCPNQDLSKTEKLDSQASSDEQQPEQQQHMLSYEEASGTPSNIANSIKDNENNSVHCEFYDRLITEIKNTLKQQTNKNISDNSIPSVRKTFNEVYSSSSTSDTSGNDTFNRKMLLKNFENLKIVLENNENDTHPIQIEQWLTEIISETEIEPIQNTEILEHSRINNSDIF